MELIETSSFTKQISELLEDDDYSKFQEILVKNPKYGSLIKGTGGLRKIRYSIEGKGKRGGIRVIYYFVDNKDIVFLLYAYKKNNTETLTKEQEKILSSVVKTLKKQY